MQELYNTYKGPVNFLAGFIVTLVVMWAFTTLHGTTTPEATLVYNTCMQSRGLNDGATEERCGQLQDQYKYEFLCTDITADAGCWVEKNEALGDK